MRENQPRPPVIIIGMHRSGTSLITNALNAMGLFTGWRLEENHEALFFQKHNKWLLRSCGGRWDIPECINYLYGNREARELAAVYLRRRLSSLACLEFLGPLRFARYRSLLNIGEPWGWKDPRTTLTLPIWLEMFPGARVIHIVRNGVDVADSLCRRNAKALRVAGEKIRRRVIASHIPYFKGVFWESLGESPRVYNHVEAFKLWEEYTGFAIKFTKSLNDHLLEIRYEDFTGAPERSLARAVEFCGLGVTEESMGRLLATIQKERSFHFKNDEKLRAFWGDVKDSPMMVRYGYNKLEIESG